MLIAVYFAASHRLQVAQGWQQGWHCTRHQWLIRKARVIQEMMHRADHRLSLSCHSGDSNESCSTHRVYCPDASVTLEQGSARRSRCKLQALASGSNARPHLACPASGHVSGVRIVCAWQIPCSRGGQPFSGYGTCVFELGHHPPRWAVQ